MSDSLLSRFALAALAATFLVPAANCAFAQTADNRSTAEIERENAALRAKVHRLEAEKDNVALHAKVDQLQGRPPVQAATTESAQGGPQQLVTRIQTSAPDRTLVMADMPMKAAALPAAYYSWTGFYLGGNIGYGLADDRARSSLDVFNATGSAVNTTAGETVVTPAGAIGGVQLGYNWQGGPNWLVGFEADFQSSAQKATSCVAILCEKIPGNQSVTPTLTQDLDYFGTLRGRFGFLDRGNLFYVTGGGAYGHVNQTLDLRASNAGPPTASFSGSASESENKFGWVVGAGMESSLGGNWTGKVEYLYMDLGSTANALNGVFPAGVQGGGSFTFGSASSLRDNIVRAGLNYRFGPPAGPVSAYDAMAAIPPVAAISAWSGFYVGANVGYGFANDHTQQDLLQSFTGSSTPSLLATSEPGTSVAPRGALGGAQFGYNWQAAPHWLVGFEADFQGTAQNDTACISLVCFNQILSTGATLVDNVQVQHQLDYFGTARGRIGAIFNNTLFYATGGAAVGRVRDTLHVDFAGTNAAGSLFVDQTTAKDLTGYVVGGGIEAMLWGGWSAKAEYLYMNLGSFSTSLDASLPGNPATWLSNSTVRDHIVRVGANYHFGVAPY